MGYYIRVIKLRINESFGESKNINYDNYNNNYTVKPREGTMNNFVPSRNRWNQDYLASAFHHWLDEQTLRNMSKKLESSWKHWSSDAGHDIGRTAGQVKTVRTVQAGQMWMRKTMSVLSGWPLTAQIWLHNLVRAENFMPVVLYAAKTYFKLCPF